MWVTEWALFQPYFHPNTVHMPPSAPHHNITTTWQVICDPPCLPTSHSSCGRGACDQRGYLRAFCEAQSTNLCEIHILRAHATRNAVNEPRLTPFPSLETQHHQVAQATPRSTTTRQRSDGVHNSRSLSSPRVRNGSMA